MSTPSIKVGQGNWGIKATSLLGYANTDKKFVAREFTVGRLLDTATRVNASGNIEGVNANIPRIDYFGGQASLLVEPSATNLCLQSEAFNTTWTRVSGGTGLLPVITANAVVAPDGTMTADTVVFDRNAVSGSANFSQLQQDINFPTSGTYTFGVYAKATTSGDVGKQFYIRTRNALVSGSLTSSWVRYTSTETGLSSGNNPVYIGNRGGFTADQTVSVDLWGAQLETGTVATSYIPTTTGAVTRNADVISVTGVAGLIGQTEGTLYVEWENKDNGLSNLIETYNNSSGVAGNSSILIQKNANNGLNIRVFDSLGNYSDSFTVTMPIGKNKVALAYQLGSAVLYLNGSLVGSNSRTYVFSSSRDAVSFDPRGAYPRASAALYTTRLPNTTTDGSPSLQSITTL